MEHQFIQHPSNIVELIWNGNIEPENRQTIEARLKPLLWLLPKWCQKFHINLYQAGPADEGTSLAEVDVDINYRYITLNIYSGWLTDKPHEQTGHLLHELVHTFFNPLYFMARRHVRGTSSEEVFKLLSEELRGMNEQVTQDVARAIHYRLDVAEQEILTIRKTAADDAWRWAASFVGTMFDMKKLEFPSDAYQIIPNGSKWMILDRATLQDLKTPDGETLTFDTFQGAYAEYHRLVALLNKPPAVPEGVGPKPGRANKNASNGHRAEEDLTPKSADDMVL